MVLRFWHAIKNLNRAQKIVDIFLSLAKNWEHVSCQGSMQFPHTVPLSATHIWICSWSLSLFRNWMFIINVNWWQRCVTKFTQVLEATPIHPSFETTDDGESSQQGKSLCERTILSGRGCSGEKTPYTTWNGLIASYSILSFHIQGVFLGKHSCNFNFLSKASCLQNVDWAYQWKDGVNSQLLGQKRKGSLSINHSHAMACSSHHAVQQNSELSCSATNWLHVLQVLTIPSIAMPLLNARF